MTPHDLIDEEAERAWIASADWESPEYNFKDGFRAGFERAREMAAERCSRITFKGTITPPQDRISIADARVFAVEVLAVLRSLGKATP